MKKKLYILLLLISIFSCSSVKLSEEENKKISQEIIAVRNEFTKALENKDKEEIKKYVVNSYIIKYLNEFIDKNEYKYLVVCSDPTVLNSTRAEMTCLLNIEVSTYYFILDLIKSDNWKINNIKIIE